MNSEDYTPEQKVDIEARVEKAKVLLAELNLQPGCFVVAQNTGNDVFALKTIPYLQDTLYSPKVSPLTKNDL